jgi:hypothetical protein
VFAPLFGRNQELEMDPRGDRPWGERLGSESGEGEQSAGRLIRDAVGVVRGRFAEVARVGIQPLLHDAAAQVRPASLEELRSRYPGLPDDEVARRLTERAARTAAAVALGIGGLLAAQEAVAVAGAAAPPAGGAALGTIGVTALAEVLVLFVIEAKLRADLGVLAGQPSLTPRELAAGVLGEVQAAGGLAELRRRSVRRALPVAAVRRTAARIAAIVPARFARIVIPEVVAPLVGSAIAARLASRQVRAAGERHWAELRRLPPTTVTWRPATGNGEVPPNPSRAYRAPPPPDDSWDPRA